MLTYIHTSIIIISVFQQVFQPAKAHQSASQAYQIANYPLNSYHQTKQSQQLYWHLSRRLEVDLDPQLEIALQYADDKTGVPRLEIMYGGGQLNPAFEEPPYIFNCANLDLFILKLSHQQNLQYYWLLNNYTQNLTVTLYRLYAHSPGPSNQTYTCLPNFCNITIVSNCDPILYSTNIVKGMVSGSTSNFSTKFQYNTICNESNNQAIQVQWGVVIVVIFSILMVFISSKFQNLQSYDNMAIYINYYIIAIYFTLVVVKNVLLTYQVEYVPELLNYVCIGFSFALGSVSGMLCFCQFAYVTKIRWLRYGYEGNVFRFRFMELIGFLIGAGLVVLWYMIHENWIVSDVIFTIIYISFNKVFKIGSMKIAVILFIFIMIIDGAFFRTTADINNPYTNLKYKMFNNPLFLIVPIIQHVPNRRCVWYFLLSIAYPGMFLSYLERFDKNRSSIVYGMSFVLCYTFCSVTWLFLSAIFINVVPFMVLPYELFTIPFVIGLMVLFANRRGELKDLWTGEFYDQNRNYFQNQKQIIQQIRSDSHKSYQQTLFARLKYGQNTSDLNSKQSKGESNLSELNTKKAQLQLSEFKRSFTFDVAQNDNQGNSNIKNSQNSAPAPQNQGSNVDSTANREKPRYNSLYLNPKVQEIDKQDLAVVKIQQLDEGGFKNDQMRKYFVSTIRQEMRESASLRESLKQ